LNEYWENFVTFFTHKNAINGFSSSSSPPTTRFGVSLFALEPQEDGRVGREKRGFVPDARGPVFSITRFLRNAITA
jgi:hypothetical protein